MPEMGRGPPLPVDDGNVVGAAAAAAAGAVALPVSDEDVAAAAAAAAAVAAASACCAGVGTASYAVPVSDREGREDMGEEAVEAPINRLLPPEALKLDNLDSASRAAVRPTVKMLSAIPVLPVADPAIAVPFGAYPWGDSDGGGMEEMGTPEAVEPPMGFVICTTEFLQDVEVFPAPTSGSSADMKTRRFGWGA